MSDCLDGIVGLSDRDCPCFDDEEGRPVDWNSSTSGYYITDADHGSPLPEELFQTKDCSGSSIWAMLLSARDKAIRDIRTDLRAALYRDYTNRFKKFSGWIAEDKKSSVITSLDNLVGIELDPGKDIRGGCITISRIALGMNGVGSIDVMVYSSDDLSAPVHTENIATLANAFAESTLVTPLALPLSSETCDRIMYYLVYDPGALKPLNNRIDCGCAKKPEWYKFLKGEGIKTGDLENDSLSRSKYAYGLRIDATLECKDLQWICDAPQFGEFDAMDVFARAIQCKAAIILEEELAGSTRINRATMTRREERGTDQKQRRQDYVNYISWIAENVPKDINDCFTCNPKSARIQKRSILV